MRSEVPANFPLSKKYFSLKGSFFFHLRENLRKGGVVTFTDLSMTFTDLSRQY